MELPTYHAPSMGNVLRATWERGWSFIKRAGTIILLSSIILWFLQGYGFTEAGVAAVEDNNESLLAAVNEAIAAAIADGSMDKFVAEAQELSTGEIIEGLLDDAAD